jgi:hypothetical protein
MMITLSPNFHVNSCKRKKRGQNEIGVSHFCCNVFLRQKVSSYFPSKKIGVSKICCMMRGPKEKPNNEVETEWSNMVDTKCCISMFTFLILRVLSEDLKNGVIYACQWSPKIF